MSTATGFAIIDFGSFPGANEASIAVTGQATISAGAKVEAFVMADDSTINHTADDHKYFGVFAGLTCGAVLAGTGFTIYARSAEKLTGQWRIRWVWAD